MYSFFKGVNLSIFFEKNNYLYLKIYILRPKIQLYIFYQNKFIDKMQYLTIISRFYVYLYFKSYK